MDSWQEAKPTQIKDCVKVAVNIRPLVTTELLVGCTDCITVVPGEPQVQIGSHSFTYDYVYGSSGTPSSIIFDECVSPLVDAIFHGYNATVLAYGQTGSGKSYTMGTNYPTEANSMGIIPQVVDTIFKKIDIVKDNTEFLIRVSFIEIFKEEVFDLLDPNLHSFTKADDFSIAKPVIPSRTPIQIRETVNGGITLAGVTEAEVRSKEEMLLFLSRGTLSRATGSTNMNSQSSRSHAVFTILMEQRKITNFSCGVASNEFSDDILSAKLHLVDLAGSERAKRTGADGLRFKEGVHINKGLLALGNVISALGDEKKRKEGGHVPYRDSKLTRLLQDSLGGNTKTLMIACISPSDTNAEETINTLKYANRARNIQNKAVVNRDPVTAEMHKLRSQLEQLQAELLYCRGGGPTFEELEVFRHKVSLLEARNLELHHELKDRKIACDRLAQQALDAQVEKDKLILTIELARSGKPWDEIDKAADKKPELDLLKSYLTRIQELETELVQAQSLSNLDQNGLIDCIVEKNLLLPSLHDLASGSESKMEDDEKEREHSSLQDILDKELQELDMRLVEKEAEMKRFATVDTSVLKQHYERKLLDLEQEKKALQKEIEDLRINLANISSVSGDGAQKLKENYLQKLNMLEAQVSDLKKKQEAQSQLLRQKQKTDEAAKRLQEEIQRIKSQKVQLQHKIKQESEQFRSWKATREKEVLQLKKEGRRNEYEMHKLLALNQRQKMVLQRKTEEATMATKRLKELLDTKKISREISGPGNANVSGLQALMQAIEHELEVTVRVHEVRTEYERQMKERVAMAKEVTKLKDEAELFKQKITIDCPQTMSPSARNSRLSALQNMLGTSSSTLVSMASQLSEAEERERVFSGRGRWNQVRSLAEAKNIMNYLFNLVSSSRCLLRDKEANCREKESEITELKEKLVRHSSLVRKLESERTELHCQNLQVFPRGKNNVDLQEDMDTSDSEQSDSEYDLSDEDWVESEKKKKMKKYKQTVLPVKHNVEGANYSKNIKSETTEDNVCCSCSRFSLCKTKKCECRAVGGVCGASCFCAASKCANRQGRFIFEEADETSPHSELVEPGGCHSSSDNVDVDKSRDLVSRGTTLLQSALTEGLSRENGDVKHRKPLTDIGNTVVKPKQTRRKNWHKSAIQVVPIEPLPPAAPQNEEARTRANVPLRLPRAMDSAHSNDDLSFGNRNLTRSDESMGSSSAHLPKADYK